MTRRTITYILTLVVCLTVWLGYSWERYTAYRTQISVWEAEAKEAFREALQQEIGRHKGHEVRIITTDAPQYQTLQPRISDTVWAISEYGKRPYPIPQIKADNCLYPETRQRIVVSSLLEKDLLSVDSVQNDWNRRLASRQNPLQGAIRYRWTDLLGKTVKHYSVDSLYISCSDSLLSYYLGFRCEGEFTGYILSGKEIEVIAVWVSISLFGLFFLLILLFFLRIYDLCARIWLKIHTKETAKREVVVVEKVIEKEIPVKEIFPLSQTAETSKTYLLGNLLVDFDARTITCGEKKNSISKNSLALLRLFILAEEHKVSREEIAKTLWGEDFNMDKLHAAVSRLRKVLSSVSSYVIELDEDVYTLKSPISSGK